MTTQDKSYYYMDINTGMVDTASAWKSVGAKLSEPFLIMVRPSKTEREKKENGEWMEYK